MSILHNLTALNFLAVGVGAAFGAWARWLLGLALNPLFFALPLGTLAANVIGGYLVGMAVGLFHLNTHFPGGLEAVRDHRLSRRADHLLDLLGRSRRAPAGWPAAAWAIGLASLHLAGSLTATWLGLLTVGATRIWS